MERVILHVDCNKFYASVECALNPELKDKPVAVGGSEELRHGIILTKNEIAEKYGIKTAEPLWSARQKCPDLIIVKPNFSIYYEYSKRIRDIFYQYTDLIEPFGLDESWLDVTASQYLFGTGEEIANKIREQVKKEVGITVSIGVSYNKIFSKLGSDYKKPDAVTVFNKENFKNTIWKLPVGDMLMVGSATTKKLNSIGIMTIGDLAKADINFIKNYLGKHGEMIHLYANGYDNSPVKHIDNIMQNKSFGNSTTTPRDLVNDEDVNMVFSILADSVARRMREQGVKGKIVTISVRDINLKTFTRQAQLDKYTNLSSEIKEKANEIFKNNYNWLKPIRSLGISVNGFEHEDMNIQLDMLGVECRREKMEKLERTMDNIKDKYGTSCICHAIDLKDKSISEFNPYDKSIMHNFNNHS